MVKIRLFKKKWKNIKYSISRRIKQFIVVLKQIYSVISVISTLAVFSALLLFVFGRIGNIKLSEDDLIMKEIVYQIPNDLTIQSIEMIDIHGFGNESIIVFASNSDYIENSAYANQILILDKVENDILNRMYHFLGFGSKYKLMYKFTLGNSLGNDFTPLGYKLDLLETVELTGDTNKELVVSIMTLPAGTSGYYEVAIISYSYDTHSYFVLGSYPSLNEVESDYLTRQNEYGFYDSGISIENAFHIAPLDEYNYYNKNELFNLTICNHDDFYYFYNVYSEKYLVQADMIWGPNESHVSPHKYIIRVYRPTFDSIKKELNWFLAYSFINTDYMTSDSKEYIEQFLIDNQLGWIVKSE